MQLHSGFHVVLAQHDLRSEMADVKVMAHCVPWKGGFLTWAHVHIIHGRQDPLATMFFARRVQRRLRCKFTLTGAGMSLDASSCYSSLALPQRVPVVQ